MTDDGAQLTVAVVKRYAATAGARRAALVRSVAAWRDLDGAQGEVIAALTGPWPQLVGVLDGRSAAALGFDALDLCVDLAALVEPESEPEAA